MRWPKSWRIHNLVAHPLSEVLYQVSKGLQSAGFVLEVISHEMHDATVPDHEPGTGRG